MTQPATLLLPGKNTSTTTEWMTRSQKALIDDIFYAANEALAAASETLNEILQQGYADSRVNSIAQEANVALGHYRRLKKINELNPDIFSAMARVNIALANVAIFQGFAFPLRKSTTTYLLNIAMNNLTNSYDTTVDAYRASNAPLSKETQNAFDRANDVFSNQTSTDAEAIAAISEANAAIAIADRSLVKLFISSAANRMNPAALSALTSERLQHPFTEEILRDQSYPLGTVQECDCYQFYNYQMNLLKQELKFDSPILLISYPEQPPDGSILHVVPVNEQNWEEEKKIALLFDEAPVVWIGDQRICTQPQEPTTAPIPPQTQDPIASPSSPQPQTPKDAENYSPIPASMSNPTPQGCAIM